MGFTYKIHGHWSNGKPSPTWISWNHMKDRCTNKHHVKYKLYGGRGIKIDTKWKVFTGFLEDMGIRPKNTSLDRINSNGHYTKENCRWASSSVQNNNRCTRRIKENKYDDI